MAIFPGSAIPSAADDYTIDYSCRFYHGWLSKTFSGAGDLDKWTVSVWMKNNGGIASGSNGLNGFLYSQADNNDKTVIWSHGSATRFQNMYAGDTVDGYLAPSGKIRDPSSWYHFVFVWDSGNATEGERIRMWKNGVRVTAFGTSTYPPIDKDSYINKAAAHQIGYYLSEGGGQYYAECYFADYYFLDGQAEDADAFGELDSGTNQWIPKDAADDLTFGTNGFYLKFQDSAALGDDSSGNNNDFAVNSIDANDQMLDTPTNNFATMNPLDRGVSSKASLSEGNLKDTSTGTAWTVAGVRGSFGVSSGKWYWEVLKTTTNDYSMYGVANSDCSYSESFGTPSNSWTAISETGNKFGDGTGGSGTSYMATWTNGDIIGIALNCDDGELTFYKNNATQGVAFTSLAGKEVFPYLSLYDNADSATVNFGSDSSFAGAKTAQGNQDGNEKGDFYYEPPSGYLALCTDNLSDPEIKLPSTAFKAKLYTGDGATTQAITGLGHQPDYLWVKNRDTNDNFILTNSVRGATKYTTIGVAGGNDGEVTDATYINSYNSDGFTVGNSLPTNTNTENYVAYSWKGGGAAVANTDGTVTGGSSVSANTTSGFSLVEFDGDGSIETVGHGLSQAPEFIYMKGMTDAGSGTDFPTGGTGMGFTTAWAYYNYLNGSWAESASAAWWNDTAPTSSVFTIGASGTPAGKNPYVAFCFHSVEGFSKIGYYVSTNNVDGPFIYTGFKPAFIYYTDVGSATNRWRIYDAARNTYNILDKTFVVEDGGGDTTSAEVDFLSNGWKVRTNSGDSNPTGSQNMMYIAFAESPFKYSNAR